MIGWFLMAGAVRKEFSMPDKEPVAIHTVKVTYRYQVRVIAIVEIRRHVEVVAPNADEAVWMVEAMIDKDDREKLGFSPASVAEQLSSIAGGPWEFSLREISDGEL
jgi:hypothetical protein